MREREDKILPDPEMLATRVLQVSRREAVWRKTWWWGVGVGLLGAGAGFWGGAEWWRMAAVFATGVGGSVATRYLLFQFAQKDLEQVWPVEK